MSGAKTRLGARATERRFQACKCSGHENIYQNWPGENATLCVATCMETCPYCGIDTGNGYRLRKHLNGSRYKSRHITITKERPGQSGVEHPSFTRHDAIHSTGNSAMQSNFVVPISTIEAQLDTSSRPVQMSHAHMIEDILSSLDGFQEEMVNMLGGLELSTWGDIRNETSDIESYETASRPRLLKTEQCWKSRPPSTYELILATLDLLSQPGPGLACTAFSRGEADAQVDPREAIAQLIVPQSTDPIFLTGLRFSAVPDIMFRIPVELSTFVEPFHETNVQMHLTPKYSFVDLHIDYGTDGLSATLDNCVKIWILFPPTTHNLLQMRRAEGQKAKLLRLGSSLGHGVILKTFSKDAIYIPAGWLHATFTIEGGYLIAKDFTTPGSVMPFSRYLSSGLDKYLSTTDQKMCFDWFADCLELALANGHVIPALDAWILSSHRVQDWRRTVPKWASKVRKIWESFLSSEGSHQATCPCGQFVLVGFFPQHFKDYHIWPLDPELTNSEHGVRRLRSAAT